MKKIFLFLFFLTGFVAASQDVILTKSGDEVKAIVLERRNNKIWFHELSKPRAPIYTINEEEVVSIRYAQPKNNVSIDTATYLANFDLNVSLSHYELGMRDANVAYREYKNAGYASFITTFFFAPVGLAASIATAGTSPRIRNLSIPENELSTNHAYIRGYYAEAKRIKKRRVWSSFAAGIGAILAVNLIFEVNPVFVTR